MKARFQQIFSQVVLIWGLTESVIFGLIQQFSNSTSKDPAHSVIFSCMDVYHLWLWVILRLWRQIACLNVKDRISAVMMLGQAVMAWRRIVWAWLVLAPIQCSTTPLQREWCWLSIEMLCKFCGGRNSIIRMNMLDANVIARSKGFESLFWVDSLLGISMFLKMTIEELAVVIDSKRAVSITPAPSLLEGRYQGHWCARSLQGTSWFCQGFLTKGEWQESHRFVCSWFCPHPTECSNSSK